jgi:hypothetical protein
MRNKKETMKIAVFSFAIFTLLLSLFNFGYSKYRDVYFNGYNQKVYSDFYNYKNQNNATESDYKNACLSFMPSSFYKINHVTDYWNGLFVWLSVFMLLAIKTTDIKFKHKIFSKKDERILFSAIFLSFILYYYIGMAMDNNYNYFSLGCSKFLL